MPSKQVTKPDPFAEFDAIEGKAKPITKTIGGKRFTFPGDCPADVGMKMAALSTNKEISPGDAALYGLTELLGEEGFNDLSARISLPGLRALALGIFKHYGLLVDAEVADLAARRAKKKGKTTGRK